jgi:hypothetical protein
LVSKFPKNFVIGTAIGPADYPFKPREQTSQPVEEAITLFVQDPDDPLCKANPTFKQSKVVYLPNPGTFSDYGRKVCILDSEFEFVDQGNKIGKETTQSDKDKTIVCNVRRCNIL